MSKTVSELLNASMAKVRDMVDANTVVGSPICVNADTTIIPVSKITFGFASGGADLGAKAPNTAGNFGGGAGCGVNITPIALIVVQGEKVRVQPVDVPPASPAERMIEQIPTLVDKLTEMIELRKEVFSKVD